MEPVAQKAEGFDVFISYAREDAAFAHLLAKTLKNYSPPRGLGLPAGRLRVFIDHEDIRGTEYFQTIGDFLSKTNKLLLLCSPHSRRSTFVDDEVKRFIEARGAENVIPVLVSGIPNNEVTPETAMEMAFPEALCSAVKMPLAVPYLAFNPQKDSISKGVFYGSWYTTLANIYGVSRSDMEQRDKKRHNRNRAITVATLTAIIAALCLALVLTVQARQRAIESRDKAVKAQEAERLAKEAERSAKEAEQTQRKLADQSAIEARQQRDIATDQRNEALAQRRRAENALARASARFLTLQARDELRQSPPRALLLGAAAIEATAGQNYVEPTSENFLRSALAQVRGRPLSVTGPDELPFLYQIKSGRALVSYEWTSEASQPNTFRGTRRYPRDDPA